MRTHANFTRVDKIEAIYERSRVNVLQLNLAELLFYFIYARRIYLRSHRKLKRQRNSTLNKGGPLFHSLLSKKYITRYHVNVCLFE